MPEGWATSMLDTITSTSKKGAIAMAQVQTTGPTREDSEDVAKDNDVGSKDNNPVEVLVEMETSSHTLGEEDTDCSPEVRNIEPERKQVASAIRREDKVQPQPNKIPWEMETSSHTLGEEDTDCSPKVRNIEPERKQVASAIRREDKVQPQPNKIPWASLFVGSNQRSEGTILQKVEVRNGRVKLLIEDVEPAARRWQHSLVGYFGGRFLSKKALDLIVASWKLPNLPLSMWGNSSVAKICSRIGNPICVDKYTANCERISYARAMVEIDVAKEMIECIEVELPSRAIHKQVVYYENLPKFYANYRIIGHSASSCKVGGKIKEKQAAKANPGVQEVGVVVQIVGQDDFNVVLKGEEKTNGLPFTQYETSDFQDCCYKIGVEDLRSTGMYYTWSNNTVWSKLDRVMVNSKWLQEGIPALARFGLPGKYSDHSPCIVSLFDNIEHGIRPFKFFNMWTQHSDFFEAVRNSWSSWVEGTAMLIGGSRMNNRGVKEARGQVNVVGQFSRNGGTTFIPYTDCSTTATTYAIFCATSATTCPTTCTISTSTSRNEDDEMRTKVTSIEQQLGKMNSILESLVISQQMQGRFSAQPQQNPKPTNCIEETHEHVQAITTLRSGKEIDKTIAPKRVIQGEEKSKELGDLGLEELKPTRVTLELTDRSVKVPSGIIEDVLIQVDTVYYPVDFIVLDTQPVDCESSKRHIPVILGKPFLATANAVIHCRHGLLKLSFGNMTLETNIFTVGKQMREVDQIEEINVIEYIIQEHVDREFMEDLIERALVWSEPHDQLESESVSFRDTSIVGKESESVLHVGHWTPTFEPLAPSVVKLVSSEEKPPIPERKPLPFTLKYAFLGEDRVMVNSKWLQEGIPALARFGLPGKYSDHSPCIVSLFDNIEHGIRPFKFFNMWTQHSDFFEAVRNSWSSWVEGTAMYRLRKKLKGLKEPLRKLNRHHFSHISVKSGIVEEELL
ncbi:hypothetical protein Acr_00g0078440 [Actinidia rufa]|uniref:DNAse I-like superfamily protein n=1 Tax=Actinidia rufa TaxID=165716 RepID=A0A7J0DTV3_9ERIC|nr:hypothetical protein Acr_00g0078440 [Actinidia rufa]